MSKEEEAGKYLNAAAEIAQAVQMVTDPAVREIMEASSRELHKRARAMLSDA